MRYPLSLASHDSRSVLAVKGPLRRFAPWTAPGRSEGMAVYEGKGRWVSGRKGPFGHTSVLSRSGGVGFTRRAVAERRSRESGLTCPGAEAIRDLVFRVLSLQGMAF